MTKADEEKPAPITIKKYANRRLYNTATSSYVTLDHLAGLVKEGADFVVYDAKTGEDITRSVLTQIIVEEESKGGQNLLPISFLRQLIAFYGDSMQWAVPRYLEHSMQAFSSNQERMREYMKNSLAPMGGMPAMFPFGAALEEMAKQNMALFDRAFQVFSPYSPPASGSAAPQRPAATGNPAEDALNMLQSRLDELQQKIDKLSK